MDARRNFYHLCGSPISTPKRDHRQSFDDGVGSPDQRRSPEPAQSPPLRMKDAGARKRATLATAATEQDALFDSCPSFSMDASMSGSIVDSMVVDDGDLDDDDEEEDDDEYDDDDDDGGAETDTCSSTHMSVQDAREARIPHFLSEDASPPYLPDQLGADSGDGTKYSRVGGRRGSIVAAHESIDLKDLALERVIGEGAFGKVYKGMWRHKPVAVKVLLHQDLRPDVVREFETEVQIMSVLNHPNICMLLGACLEPSNRALVLELVDQGSLWVVLRSRRRQITDALRAKFILETARGMNYLHQFKRPILHRDMKSPNLLVQKDFSIKISDFGLARVKAQIQTMTGNCGTVQWMAYVPLLCCCGRWYPVACLGRLTMLWFLVHHIAARRCSGTKSTRRRPTCSRSAS